MRIERIENSDEIREAFVRRFVTPWEDFRIKHKDWISETAQNGNPIDINWYKNSYMWDKIDSNYSEVSMNEALEFLRTKGGRILFMSEKQAPFFYDSLVFDYVAETDAHALAAQIERDWYESYRFAERGMVDENAILPEDLYVFDSSMSWCAVFTHETSDWESDDMMKEAESRICIICKA